MGIILEHKHIIVRAEVSNPAKTMEELEAWISDLVEAVNMKIASVPGHKNPISWDCKIPGNVGKTCVAIIETSNIAYHDWETEYGALIQLDLYSCGPFTVEQVVGQIEKFDPLKIEYTFIDREHTLTLIESKT